MDEHVTEEAEPVATSCVEPVYGIFKEWGNLVNNFLY